MSEQAVAVHPTGALMRRFVVDWLDRADPEVPREIMAPEYTIVIAGVEMVGRDAYVEATGGQLARFPGLTVTVHDAIYTPDGRAALRFTEHGASARGGSASWRGIGLFRSEGGRLVHNATEEDYLGRRRQLLAGEPDPVDPPMVAPWTAEVVACAKRDLHAGETIDGIGGTTVYGAVRYYDTYERTTDGWKIKTREMAIIHVGPWDEVGSSLTAPNRARWPGADPAPADLPRSS